MKLTQAFLKQPVVEKPFLQNRGFLLLIYLTITLSTININYSQQNLAYNLGKESEFSKQLMSQKKSELTLIVSKDEKFTAKINIQEGNEKEYKIIGTLLQAPNASFSITKHNGTVEGTIIFHEDKKAYQYVTDDMNQVIVKPKNIHKVLCVDFKKNEIEDEREIDSGISSKMALDLQSLPGSEFTVYLDFDGEVVSGTSWAGGSTINAQATGYNDQKITNIWRIMAEDFRPFDINITTNRSIYENTPKHKRMMCIFTPTDTAAPGSGGVAYLNSFSSTNSDNPCWVYNSGTRSAGETGSHEVGHTLGLSHDGVPGNQYYAGHGQWSPIMGWSANKPLGHWSKGEYDNAVNSEDDLAIITNSRNGFGYKQDDHGNSVNEATEIAVDTDGNVSSDQNTGLITTTEDKDVFSFITSGGNVSFTIDPDPYYPNLNIQAKILNGLGEEVEVVSPTNSLGAEINTTLSGGTYFLEIDGVGEGNLSTGYSDYSSIGFYSISGSYTPGDNNQPPIANFEVTTNCSTATFKNTSINTVTSYLWDFGDGNTSELQNPEHIYANSGQYTVSLTVTNANGSDTNTQNNIVDVTIASLPDGSDQTTCSGEPATLTVSGSNGYIWYDQPQNGNIIGTGSIFHTPEIIQNQSFYVSGTTKSIINGNVGISNVENNSGNIHNGGFYLVFDITEPILLKKAKVVAQGTKERTLELKDASGTIIESKTINISDGESIIDLDLTIQPGNNLQIGFTEGADLFRSNQNVNYPYQIENVVLIKQSTATSNPSDFYYYLYDWQVSTLGECETNDRTEIAVSILDSPQTPSVSFNSATNEISTDGTYHRYQWYRNNEMIQGATSASYIVEQNGEYALTVYNTQDCSAVSESILVETLSIDTPTPDAENITIYPNPAKNILYINGIEDTTDIYSIKVVNILGQSIARYNKIITSIDTSGLEEGVYFLVINNQWSKKFLKTAL